MVEFGQRFQPRQHPHRPAIGQFGIQTGGHIDFGGAKAGAGETVNCRLQTVIS